MTMTKTKTTTIVDKVECRARIEARDKATGEIVSMHNAICAYDRRNNSGSPIPGRSAGSQTDRRSAISRFVRTYKVARSDGERPRPSVTRCRTLSSRGTVISDFCIKSRYHRHRPCRLWYNLGPRPAGTDPKSPRNIYYRPSRSHLSVRRAATFPRLRIFFRDRKL